ncbi:MAG: hypothetical protein PHZ26_04575 [Candidatus Gracilibacteria bacterium]|nr:hypothetical protein [Candidatus Gracilibacteria bacterium]MDD2909002.1 hypothetical protein [Candidatus Gracilibacteria bacterium]
MRDNRFVAEHRGGPLTKEQHKLLIKWSIDCVRHILSLYGENIDLRILYALDVADKWEKGNATVGDARNAAFGVIVLARELTNPTQIAITRAAGHAVATAHMADHAPGGAEYALKAIIYEGKSFEEERKYQDEILPDVIRELVLSSRGMKAKSWNTSFTKARKERGKLKK